MSSLQLTVTTLERELLNLKDVVRVTIPTVEGEITVFPNHVPLMSVLSPGELRIVETGEQTTSLFVDQGILQVTRERVEILADLAEHTHELDAAKIEEAKRRAEKLIAERPANLDVAKLEATLQRELARLKLAQKYRKSHSSEGGI